MKTLQHIDDLLEGKIQRIFVIEKFDRTYIMAVIPNYKGTKHNCIAFIEIKYHKKIHCSDLCDDTFAQSVQCLSKAFKNGDEVMLFDTEAEFQKWQCNDIKIDDLLRKPYWIYWGNSE